MIKKVSNNTNRLKRHLRIRNKVNGTKEIPRLVVFRSNKEIYAQLIDDISGTTLASASSMKTKNGGNIEGAKEVGKLIADVAKTLKIKKVVFDRAGYAYHGRIAALAEEARKNGLEF